MVGGGTAPDTRRPSKRWQATPPGDGTPPPPRHAAPTGHASQGDSVGPPRLHTRTHSTWVADPDSPPEGRAVRGGGEPDLRRPSQRRKALPPGDALPPHEDLSVLLLELALEKESDQHLDAYRLGGGGSGSHGKGYQGPRPGQGTTSKHAHIMHNVRELFWCDARDKHGHLQHAPDCDQRDCFVVQGKKQETNTGSKPKMPDHYRCTITCAFCGKRKHYEDECYHKQRLSAKLKGEDAGKGSGKGSGKGGGKDRNDSSKGKSKGRGKGQDNSRGGRGGGADRQQDKDNKNQDKSGGNPNPNPGEKSEPSGGQSGSGPAGTTRARGQART